MEGGKALLLVLDGAGYSEEEHGNTVTRRYLPWLFGCMEEHGYAVLEAAGQAVGLEAGQVGNSEAGHLTLGAGHVVPCMSRRILEAYEDGSWVRDAGWVHALEDRRLHVVGLLSDAGVHALDRTLVHAVRTARRAGVSEIVVHPVLDGVDSKAGSAPVLLERMMEQLRGIAGVSLGVVQGRRLFCDRSGDETLSVAFVDALTNASQHPEFHGGLLDAHLSAESESTFPPHRLGDAPALRAGDPVLITSHRADRMRQVARIVGANHPLLLLVEPGEGVPCDHVFFPQRPLDRGLAHELARAGLQSKRIAEKCKFPHVTYFFNGFDSGREGEGCCLPSIPEAEIPANPEMSIEAVTDEIVGALADPERRVVVANLANLDQVGHLGELALAERAARSVETSLCRIAAACHEHGWTLFVTGDHGNADCVTDDHGRAHGSHTVAPVPLAVLPARGARIQWRKTHGSLANVAAGVLGTLGLEVPDWMEPALFEISP